MASDDPVIIGAPEKTSEEKINESYAKIGELVTQQTFLEEQARNNQEELRAEIMKIRGEMKLKEGVRIGA